VRNGSGARRRLQTERDRLRPGAGTHPDFARDADVPYIDVACTLDTETGQLCLLMLNRDLEGERELILDCRDLTPTKVLASETLKGTDLKTRNTFEEPTRIVPQPLEAPQPGSRMTFKLPPRSYTAVHMATS
jgi:alpha-N-arabinofuranosidase